MPGIPSEVLSALISIGRSEQSEIPGCLNDEREAWYTLVRGKETWRDIGEHLTQDELAFLIKGLILYNKTGRKLGGSVSPVIELYRTYAERFPDQEPGLTEWVVDNRVNDYEPFGRICDKPHRSFADFKEWERRVSLKAAERESRKEAEIVAHREASLERRFANSVKNGDLKAVKALLDKGADPKRAVEGCGSFIELAEQYGRENVASYLRSLEQS